MRRTTLRVEHLESRALPAALDIAGGVLSFTGDSGSDTVTQSVAGTGLVFAANTAIVLTQDAYDAGFRASGNVAAGPISAVVSTRIDLAGGSNVVNVRNNPVPLEVDCSGVDTVNVCGNAPTNTASLATIITPVSVIGSGNNDTLIVSDSGAASGNANVLIDATGIYNLAGPADDVPIHTSGLLTEKVYGSNSAVLPEHFAVAGNCGQLWVFAQAGDDTIDVTGTCHAILNGGYGADTIYVEPGVTLYGSIWAGSNAGDVVFYGAPDYGTVIGGVRV